MKKLKNLTQEIEQPTPQKTFQDADSKKEEKDLWEQAINEEDPQN